MYEAIVNAFEAYWEEQTRGETAPADGDAERKSRELLWFTRGWNAGLTYTAKNGSKA